MFSVSNLKLGARLALGFGLVIALMAVLGAVVLEQELSIESGKQAAHVYGFARTLILAALAIASLLALLIATSITRPLRVAMALAGKMAQGDLTSRIEVKSAGECGQLLRALKGMNQNLAKIVVEVRSGTEAIAGETEQIARCNTDLSQRTAEQTASMQDAASSMKALGATVKRNAHNAREANRLALEASAVALKGGAAMSLAADTMNSIDASSKRIIDIISVVDGIALQTNALALNAALEAAHAGEQGRGFAMVATEVRNLAQRSAAAVKEMKALIGDSADKVAAGTRRIDEAGRSMAEIVTSVKRVSDITGEIMAANQEQSAQIVQVNSAITQVDEITQHSAALLERVAAAAENVKQRVQTLTGAVALFELGNKANGTPAHVTESRELATRVPVKPGRGKFRARAAAPIPGSVRKPVRVTPAAPVLRLVGGHGGAVTHSPQLTRPPVITAS